MKNNLLGFYCILSVVFCGSAQSEIFYSRPAVLVTNLMNETVPSAGQLIALTENFRDTINQGTLWGDLLRFTVDYSGIYRGKRILALRCAENSYSPFFHGAIINEFCATPFYAVFSVQKKSINSSFQITFSRNPFNANDIPPFGIPFTMANGTHHWIINIMFSPPSQRAVDTLPFVWHLTYDDYQSWEQSGQMRNFLWPVIRSFLDTAATYYSRRELRIRVE